MFYIIETEEQLNKLPITSKCFVHVISNNNRYHPSLSKVSLVYYNNGEKGYILCVNHSETFSIPYNTIKLFLESHSKIFVYDKKYHSYFLETSLLIDIHLIELSKLGKINKLEKDTSAHRCLDNDYKDYKDLNAIIPVSKHYQKWESVYDNLSIDLSEVVDHLDITDAYKEVEKQGIGIIKDDFVSKYSVTNQDFFIENNTVYTQYNLYNPTGRPTNAFNGINFLAIQKVEALRKCFIPKNDYFVEFDFDAYHLRLIAKELDVELPTSSLHEYFGKLYFGKSELTPEEYQKSKEFSFRQIYGGPFEEYLDIEFFYKVKQHSDKLWDWYKCDGYYKLPTGNLISQDDLTQWKLFNYWVQNLETYTNYFKIKEILTILQSYNTKLVLITYDSFLFDYSVDDGKELLLAIKSVMSKDNFVVKHKWSKDLNL
jgi:hypothetical protein